MGKCFKDETGEAHTHSLSLSLYIYIYIPHGCDTYGMLLSCVEDLLFKIDSWS